MTKRSELALATGGKDALLAALKKTENGDGKLLKHVNGLCKHLDGLAYVLVGLTLCLCRRRCQ